MRGLSLGTRSSIDILDSFPEAPIPLITFSEKEDQLEINQQAIELLHAIEGQVAVIAVAGLYRTGKSSLLNWLLDRPSGFRVGPTIERCTRGIWLWGRPQQRTLANEEVVWVLMLDTEGLGGLEASQQYDARIFSLATLLCSTLVYNSQGSIDEKAITGLSFIANLAKHIKIRADFNTLKEEEENVSLFHSYFPSFLWIIRDFTLQLVDEDGDTITSNEYLENALKEQVRIPSNMERNRIRMMMKEFFRQRSCMTLVRPVHEEEALQQVDQLSITQLRQEFQQQLKELQDKVYKELLQPKTVQGRVLNGSMFAGLLQAYVNAINTGSVPVITSAWEGVTANECRKAKSIAMEGFINKMKEIELPLDQEEIEAFLKEAEQYALKAYHQYAMGEMTSRMEEELKEKIKQEKDQMYTTNEEHSTASCERLLQRLYTEQIGPKLISKGADGFEDIQQFTSAWTQFRTTYLSQAKGNGKLSCFVSFAEVKYAEAMRILLSRQEEMYENKIRGLETDVAKVKEVLGSVGGREQIYKEQIEQMQLSSSHILTEKAQLEAQAAAAAERIAQLEGKVTSDTQTLQQVTVERASIDGQLSLEAKKRQEIQAELIQIKNEMERMKLEKQTQAMELELLNQECEQLRQSSKGCSCIIS